MLCTICELHCSVKATLPGMYSDMRYLRYLPLRPEDVNDGAAIRTYRILVLLSGVLVVVLLFTMID